MDADDAWIAVDAKTGRGSVIRPNQDTGYAELNGRGVVLDTDKLSRHGMSRGTNVQMKVHIDLWTCPNCGSGH